MKILISGFAVFVIWCFISAWIYNDKLLPAMKKPVPVLSTSESQSREADSLMKLKALMPRELSIYFDFDKSEFKTDQQYDAAIADFRAWLEKYPGAMIKVDGYTDIVGTTEFNQELGLRRAHAAGKYLEDHGITTDRIIAGSNGEDMLTGDYITPEGRAKSRRTVISIKMQ
jgi:OmpA-OmpF porin, OOP family